MAQRPDLEPATTNSPRGAGFDLGHATERGSRIERPDGRLHERCSAAWCAQPLPCLRADQLVIIANRDRAELSRMLAAWQAG
jgi:hypothetical protein